MTPGRPILRMEHAGRCFRLGAVEVAALSDVTLDIHAGELLVVEGPSGSGKSTLLNLLGGLDRADQGRVQFGALDLGQASDAQLTRYRRSQVGFIFQFYNLVPTLTALENVQIVTDIADRPMDAREALDLVGLMARAGHFPAELSGGEQQRVAVARAIAGSPRLLLCDEPTGALDVASGQAVMALLGRMRARLGSALVVITHNPAIAAAADRVVTLRDGRLVEVIENADPVPLSALAW